MAASVFICGFAALRQRALRPQLKRDPLGAHDHSMQSTADIILRVGLALLGLALLRDGYAALRGRELWLQGSGFNSILLRGRTGRFGGLFFIALGLVLLTIAWIW